MPTIVEVAKRARVSIATVSNVIRGTKSVSPHLQRRVQAAIRALDYYPNEIARSLKVKQTRMLAMVLPDITNPFFPEVIRGAEDTAFKRGYFLLTANTDEQIGRERRIVAALRSYRVDGLLLAAAVGKDMRHIQSILNAGVAVVCIDRAVPGTKTDAVLLDNARGAHECVRHLLRDGHKRVAIITGPLQLQTGRERLQGYKEALHEAGMPTDPSLVLQGDFREESGYRLGKQLLLWERRPSALFVSNGVMTVGVLKAFDDAGIRCPGDIALATFDDLTLDQNYHLTAVVQPSYEIGARAATILIDRIERKLQEHPLVVRIAPSLVIRDSSRFQFRTRPESALGGI